MSTEHQELVGALEAPAAVKSGVKLEMTAKGPIQVKVAVYEGTTVEEMQKIKDIAVDTLQATVRQINATQDLSTPK